MDNIVLLSGNSNINLASKIADKLNINMNKPVVIEDMLNVMYQ